eukprot:15365156-Ditylum_brightwellii.AAC.1
MEANNDFSYKPVNSSTLAFYKSYICGDYNITQRRKLNIKGDMSKSPPSWGSISQSLCTPWLWYFGSKLLAKHVSTADGGINVYPLNPAFVTPTDNTTIYTNDSEDANTDGSTAAIYIVLSGLKKSKILSSIHPECLHVEEIPGLSSTAAVDASVENTGYIAFVRDDKNSTPNNDDNINASNEINKDSDDEKMPTLISGMQHILKYYA